MENICHRTLEVNGIQIHIAEQGSGPLVVLLHGFPQIWYAWRHQIPFLAEAGYHVVAPDLRGHGQSDVPAEESKYTFLHHASDVIGVINALGEKQDFPEKVVYLNNKPAEISLIIGNSRGQHLVVFGNRPICQAFIVGHDWGSSVASCVTVFRPDLVKGLVNLSVPFQPRHPKVDMLTMVRSTMGENIYIQRWQSSEEGEAEADFAKHGSKDVLTKILCSKGRVPQSQNGKTVMEVMPLPGHLPTWLKDDDLQYYADSFDKTGFTGGFNFYRNIRRTWELMAPWSNLGINTPSLFACGDQDLCFTVFHDYITGPAYKQAAPNLKDVVILPGVGHFLAEEEPEQVSNVLLKFFKENYFRLGALHTSDS